MSNTYIRDIHQYVNLYSVLTVVCFLFCIYITKISYNYAKLYHYVRWKLPGPKLDHPILGMKNQKITDRVISEWENTLKMLDSKKIARVITGPLFSVSVMDPEVAKIVYNSSAPKNQTFSYTLAPWLGEGILFGEGSHWKRNRRLLTPTFHYQSLRKFVKIMCNSSDRLIQLIKRSNTDEPVEFTQLVHNMTLEVILNCICSKDSDLQLKIDPQSQESIYTLGLEKIRSGFVARFQGLRMIFDTYYYHVEAGKLFIQGVKLTQEYLLSLIRERESETNRDGSRGETKDRYDMLDLLLKSRDEAGNGLSRKEIVAELNTFVFAGHDTTAAASSFITYFLAKYPDLQQQCREEVLGIIGNRKEIEWEDINKFNFLTCFIKESMRLYSPAIMISKTLDKSIKVDDYIIPAGVKMDIVFALIHLNPKYWTDPHKFDPTRFNDKNLSKQHPYAFIPFSAGPRNCIGQNFAMAELKVLTAKLVSNFTVSIPADYQLETELTVVHAPSGGLPIRFKPL